MKKLVITSLISTFILGATINYSFASKAVNNKKTMKENKNVKKDQQQDFYTSVIVDCTGSFLIRAMSPVLLDGKYNELYPGQYAKNMKMEDIMEGRVITYEKSLAKAKSNPLAGKKPLILKPTGIEGAIRSNPMLSRQDAIKLKLADLDGKFLAGKKVIFVY
ncbi:MAG: hypothetical protein U0457_06365 [Candidatus Sericytochromatia bacterium]